MSRESPHGNRLAQETSPYLLQHAHNPVDWYPWGAEAIERARREDKPIFLSVGYSACHWCHVMERESFENQAIADLMNASYVNVKVDREERPDIDDIYMRAVTALTGSGGWPMSVFLTPSLEPFYGTTYLPPVRAYGRPSFPDVLVSLAEAYRTRKAEVLQQGAELSRAIAAEGQVDTRGALDASALELSLSRMQQRFDAQWGGFGAAPKFPHAGDLRLCLRHAQRKADASVRRLATHSLDRMALGGVYDQLGGGFHRYSVDREWRVPHFEKMLYDTAQLVPAYLEAYTCTGELSYAQVARECCEWALREMQTDSGGFASSQDADSEGEEGRFFVWTRAQLDEVLGHELARSVAAYYDVRPEGNFEHGKSVLWRPASAALCAETLGIEPAQLQAAIAAAKPRLLEARARRVRPDTDDKVLVSWNGLMIGALAQAHQVLNEPRYLAAARRAADFVLFRMRKPDGSLHATARGQRVQHNAGLDDYAFLISALLDLYESSFDPQYVREALTLAALVETRFADPAHGGYFTVADDHEALIARLKSVQDGALPAGSGVHVLNLLRLAELTGDPELRARGDAAATALGALASRHPHAFSHLLMALDYRLQQPRAVVISGELGEPATEQLLRAVRTSFAPQRVVLLADAQADAALLPVLHGKRSAETAQPQAQAFVCENFTCHAPITDENELAKMMART